MILFTDLDIILTRDMVLTDIHHSITPIMVMDITTALDITISVMVIMDILMVAMVTDMVVMAMAIMVMVATDVEITIIMVVFSLETTILAHLDILDQFIMDIEGH